MTRQYAALFDLDGVIIDTEPVYTRIWSDIERRFPTGVDDFANKIKGTTLPDILSRYYPDKAMQECVKEALYEAEENMEYPLFDGVSDFLKDLKDAGVPAAIVTSSGDIKMERLFGIYPGLRFFFDAVVTDSMVKTGKPAPDCYLTAAESLRVLPGNCFVFEDSFNGLRAGRAAGAKVIALATTNTPDSLAPLAERVIDSFTGFKVSDMLAVGSN